MYIYIVKNPAGDVLAVNRTLHGSATELYGLDVETINGEEASEAILEKALSSVARIECRSSTNEKIIVERHFLGN